MKILAPLPDDQSQDLAAAVTRRSSTQTYYTIRFLVDRELVSDAYRAYAYFRWVDDCLDSETGTRADKWAFLQRQQSLLDACYQRNASSSLCREEQLLVDLVRHDTGEHSGLHAYLHNMMAVMAFDVERRGRLVFEAELNEYSRLLATAVTEALQYFIGHHCPPPCCETRYMAVMGTHIVHMLRDTVEDNAAGFYNVSQEYLSANNITPFDIDHPAYLEWVHSRVELARALFKQGRVYIHQVQNRRCRLAAFAYVSRFEWMLRALEKDAYHLRPAYPQRRSLQAGLWVGLNTLASLLAVHF